MAKCPSRDQLSGYVAGTLPEPAVAEIAEHVEECSPCEATVTRLEAETSKMVRALRRPAADSYAAEPQLAAALQRAAAPPREETPLPGPVSAASISAAPGGVSVEAMIARMDEAGIVPAAEARAFVAQRRPVDGKALAAELVAAGRLTKFQANLLFYDRAKELIYGDYLIADKIGSGGMGQVFRAEHRRMKRPVAIKLIRAKSLGKDEAVKRFQREVEAAAKLNHPNIVTAHDAGEKAGVHYLVMELVSGDDLGALVKKRGPLPITEAVGLVVQAGRGLAYAHGKGVVHRDIKPSNLLLDADGTVKVLDLGLARMANVGTEEGLTQTGQVMGTVDYMAPEQAIDTRSADARSDIYSLGCTLYRLLTNQSLFAGESLGAKLLAHAQQAPPSLRAARPDAPTALDEALQRMLAKQPKHRYQTMAECLAALEAAIKQGARPLPVAKALPESGPQSTQALAPAFSFAPAAPPIAPPPPGKPVPEAATPVIRTSPAGNGGRGGMNPLLLWGSLGGAAAVLIAAVVIIIRHNDGSETRIEGPGPIAIQTKPGAVPNQPPKTKLPAVPPAAGEASTEWGQLVAADDAARRAACATLQAAGFQLYVLHDGEPLMLDRKAESPKGTFVVQRIHADWDAKVTRATEPALVQLKGIRELSFAGTNLPGNFDAPQFPWEDFTQLRKFQIANNVLGKADLAALGKLTQLKELLIHCAIEPPIDWGFLDSLVNLERLQPGHPNEPQLSKGAIPHVARLTKLKALHVARTARVSGRELAPLAEISSLEELALDLTDITTGELGPLQKTRLKMLSVVALDLTDDDLLVVAKIPTLTTLNCQDNPRISDRGLTALAELPLVQLNLHGTQVTPAGVEAFRTKRPNCAVEFDPPPAATDAAHAPRIVSDDTNSLGMKFARIAPGEFDMGHGPKDVGIEPAQIYQRRVRITKPFLLGVTEVTQKQWQDVMRTEPWSAHPGARIGAGYPATFIAWNDAVQFCAELSRREKRSYRLPTEAEWEYACRAGTKTPYSFGNDPNQLVYYGWSLTQFHILPSVVGRKLPNPWGLCDMHGNVWEWCSDFFEPLPKDDAIDPKGPRAGTEHVTRGGGYWSGGEWSQSASRLDPSHSGSGAVLGFRVVLEPPGAAAPARDPATIAPRAQATGEPLALLAHFTFDGDAKNKGTGAASMELKNTEFRNGSLYLNGIYGLDNPEGYTAICRMPKLNSNSFTVIVRCKATKFSLDRSTLLTGGQHTRWLTLEWSDPLLQVGLNQGRVTHTLTSSHLQAGAWIIVACSIDVPRLKMRAFATGGKVEEFDLPSGFQFTEADSAQARAEDKGWAFTNYSNAHVFEGLIDEFQVYDRAMSATELAGLSSLKDGSPIKITADGR